MFPSINLKNKYFLAVIAGSCLLGCSKQTDDELNVVVEKSEQVTPKVFALDGNWLVTSDICGRTISGNELEKIEFSNDFVKMGNTRLSGKWVEASTADTELINTYIDQSLPGCATFNSEDFSVSSYIANEDEVLFAVSNDQSTAIRFHRNKYTFALPYSVEAVKAVIANDPFKDEPLPYDPFEINPVVDKEIDEKDVELISSIES